jgi:coenzyme F420-reducing hydrogenase alpha subunit
MTDQVVNNKLARKTITLNHIARVEGYGSLHVDISQGQLEKAEFRVLEGARFFEGFLKGTKYTEVPQVISRICAICSVSHNLVSSRAVEHALGITPSEQTQRLRKLLIYSEFIQSHVLHEYFLALPDYVRKPSAIALAATHTEIVNQAFRHKSLANEMQRKIGGRAVHPIRNRIGHFTKFPTKNELLEFKKKLPPMIDETISVIKLLRDIPNQPSVQASGDWVALLNPDEYAYFEGDLIAHGNGDPFHKSDYKLKLKEEVRPYSHTKFSTIDNQSFMVGALARLNINYNLLTDIGKEALEISELILPDKDPYHINMAQFIETVDCIQRSIDLIDYFLEHGFKEEKIELKDLKPGHGIALTEAPRGLLIHDYNFDQELKVSKVNVITPTAFNQYKMETDCINLIPKIKDEPREEIELKLNMLVRAYDPCISCSAHAPSLDIIFK